MADFDEFQHYVDNADSFVVLIRHLFETEGNDKLATLLSGAKARLIATAHDNWNGGTSIYTLYLDVPIDAFAAVSSDPAAVESQILQKVNLVVRGFDNDQIGAVYLRPLLASASLTSGTTDVITVQDDQSSRIWTQGYFRMFLSHVSAHKQKVAQLSSNLSIYGVSAFLAHEDIEPTLEWRNEILAALSTANYIIALMTPEFHASPWTDQELGFALGKGTPVLAVNLGTVPYGFVSSNQALSASFDDMPGLALRIVTTILKDQRSRFAMLDGLIVALEKVASFNSGISVGKIVMQQVGYTSSQLTRIKEAAMNNDQIKSASYDNVSSRLVKYAETRLAEVGA